MLPLGRASYAAACTLFVVAAGDAHGGKSLRPSFEGDLSTHYLSLPTGRYFVAKLVAPGDSRCKPLLPELWEPTMVNAGNWVIVLRGFERIGEVRTRQVSFRSCGAR